ncbi:hypothetical protein HWV62_8012 [Athelia sp. TMB]|nr:hypothetical protein HWV62_8012 [Athelia sp. TMB]
MHPKEALNFNSADYARHIREEDYTVGQLANNIYTKRRAIAASTTTAATSVAAAHVSGGMSLFGAVWSGRNISVERQKLAALEQFWASCGQQPLAHRPFKDTVIPVVVATAIGAFAFDLDLALADGGAATSMQVDGFMLPVRHLISGEYFLAERGVSWMGNKVVGGYNGQDRNERVQERQCYHSGKYQGAYNGGYDSNQAQRHYHSGC